MTNSSNGQYLPMVESPTDIDHKYSFNFPGSRGTFNTQQMSNDTQRVQNIIQKLYSRETQNSGTKWNAWTSQNPMVQSPTGSSF